jgi:DNA modification methylase
MIPQVAARLIKENIKNGDAILDPFCGSGTVLVESMLINKKSFGIDINPLTKLIAESKTTIYDIDELKKAYAKLVDEIEITELVEAPKFFNINFWFKPKAIEDLAKIRSAINKVPSKFKPFFLTCFSDIVRKSSNVRQGGFKLHRISEVEYKAYNPDAVAVFRKHVEKCMPRMAEFNKVLDNPPKPVILLEDTRKKTSVPEDYIDLIVTSPPYGDSRTTVAYGQFSRLSLKWLGFDERIADVIDKMLLGGLKTDMDWRIISPTLNDYVTKIEQKDAKRANDVLSFYVDLDKCFVELSRVTKKGAKICMVVGNRTVKGYQIPTHKIVQELGGDHDMKHVKTMFRNIPSKRIPLRNSPSNKKGELSNTMTQEAIVILQKI